MFELLLQNYYFSVGYLNYDLIILFKKHHLVTPQITQLIKIKYSKNKIKNMKFLQVRFTLGSKNAIILQIHRDRVECWLPGAGRKMNKESIDKEFQFCKMKSILKIG